MKTTTMAEILLVELLRKEGIISEGQASSIVSIQSLFDLLQKIKLIPPIVPDDVKIIKEWERLVNNSGSSKSKVEKILSYDLSKVGNESLRRILETMKSRIQEWLV